MEEKQEFSFWLIPEEPAFSTLRKSMENLRKAYHGPRFDPHVTLLGKINIPPSELVELVIKTESLANKLKPISTKLECLECLPDYFYKCLFMKVAKTPSLIEANEVAKTIFPEKKDEIYEPHLSMLYGNLSPEIKRESEKNHSSLLGLEFSAKRLFLYSTEGGPKKWYHVADYPIENT